MNVTKFKFIEGLLLDSRYYELVEFQPCEAKREEFIHNLYKRYCVKCQNNPTQHIAFINEFYDLITTKVHTHE